LPHSLTIAQAHQKLKKKEISSEELTRACIERIEEVDDSLHAVVHRNFDRALELAKKVDSQGSFDHPLRGIPHLTKDIFCEEGVATTGCSNVLRNTKIGNRKSDKDTRSEFRIPNSDYTPPFDATTVKRLKNWGSLSMGKTNTDEFAQGASTETSCYGVTSCPWDLTRVAGGTSGGSAAAVAADECIFALASDTGGSIRQPAGFCGCVGLRPTYGRTSRYGVMPMASSFDTTCACTKSVVDMAIVLGSIAGKDPRDATTKDMPVPDYRKGLTGNVKGLKIGLPKEYFIEGIDPEVEEQVKAAAKQFEELGAKVTEVSLPNTEHAIATYYILIPSEVSSNMARYDGVRFGHTEEAADLIDYYFKVRSAGFGDEVKRRIMLGTFALSAGYYDAYYRKAQKVRTLIQQDFFTVFEEVDLILSPVSPTPAFKIGAHTDDPVAMYLEDIFTVSQAIAGIPALSVPCGFSKEGLPIAVQLTGPQWGEEVVLRAGDTYEKARWPDGIPSPQIK